MNYDFVTQIRACELDQIRPHLPATGRVLEIGAGTGWQARTLAAWGYDVAAIDIAESRYVPDAVWPVQIYDGHCIPYTDNSFDAVFSSNVFEHISHLEAFQREISRVLRPAGVAIHVLPSSTWRLWTLGTHYPSMAKQLWQAIRRRHLGTSRFSTGSSPRRALPDLFLRALWPHRHGERGTALSEIYYFSRLFWHAFFRRTGWTIIHWTGTGIYYTGNQLLDRQLSLRRRRQLSRLLGSSTMIYVVRCRSGAEATIR